MDARSSRGTRRYYKNVPYMLPKDADESSRLDFQHYILRSILRGNHQTQISNPQLILDVGCGTGAWGHDMAREFKHTQVVGFDLEYVEKQDVPENYGFVQGNLLQGLPFQNEQFDLVYQRFLVNAIPTMIWPSVIQDIVRVATPGGWIELVEAGCDQFQPGGAACREMFEAYLRIAGMNNMNPYVIRELGNLLQQAGVTGVRSMVRRVPVGAWGGREGSLLARDMATGMMAMKDAFVRYLGYVPSQFDHLHQQVMTEWNEYHSEYAFYVFVGRKG
jgi:ubiquinone/menaquinone biosynthesis C-methylase UbiE